MAMHMNRNATCISDGVRSGLISPISDPTDMAENSRMEVSLHRKISDLERRFINRSIYTSFQIHKNCLMHRT